MVIFDTEATCESDGVVVIGATVTDGIGPDTRFTLRITRPYAERVWQIPYSRERVAAQIWVHIDEFQDLVARELAEGKTELIL
jgi:hypothetical protein